MGPYSPRQRRVGPVLAKRIPDKFFCRSFCSNPAAKWSRLRTGFVIELIVRIIIDRAAHGRGGPVFIFSNGGQGREWYRGEKGIGREWRREGEKGAEMREAQRW